MVRNNQAVQVLRGSEASTLSRYASRVAGRHIITVSLYMYTLLWLTHQRHRPLDALPFAS